MSTHTTPAIVALSAEWHMLETEIRARRARQSEIATELGLRATPHAEGATVRDHAAVRDYIVQLVCSEYGVTFDQLRSRDRHEGMVIARQMCYTLLRNHTGQSLVPLARFLGRSDHGTVLHSLEAVAARLETNPAEAARHLRLTTAIRTRFA